MASIENIKGSDGSGNANMATVQSSRAPAASTIIVDTVLGINPAGFMGSMGTPHTFTDPITSETITVISEDTCVDFAGHVDGSNLEIDAIAPGYTDLGSEVGDIIIIRPTTQWSDEIAALLEVTHNDDGTFKDNVVNTAGIVDDAVTATKIVGIDKSNLTTDSNPYMFEANNSANQGSIGTAATQLTFDTEIIDTNGNFASNQYTAPVTGLYYIYGRLQLAANVSATSASLNIYKNGADLNRIAYEEASNQGYGLNGGKIVALTAGDTVRLYVSTTGAATNTLSGSTSRTTFGGFLISRT